MVFSFVGLVAYDGGIGNELEVHTHLAPHDPRGRIPPEEDAHKLRREDVQRVPLPCMRLLVGEHLAQSLLVHAIGVDENPRTEGEGAAGTRKIEE